MFKSNSFYAVLLGFFFFSPVLFAPQESLRALFAQWGQAKSEQESKQLLDRIKKLPLWTKDRSYEKFMHEAIDKFKLDQPPTQNEIICDVMHFVRDEYLKEIKKFQKQVESINLLVKLNQNGSEKRAQSLTINFTPLLQTLDNLALCEGFSALKDLDNVLLPSGKPHPLLYLKKAYNSLQMILGCNRSLQDKNLNVLFEGLENLINHWMLVFTPMIKFSAQERLIFNTILKFLRNDELQALKWPKIIEFIKKIILGQHELCVSDQVNERDLLNIFEKLANLENVLTLKFSRDLIRLDQKQLWKVQSQQVTFLPCFVKTCTLLGFYELAEKNNCIKYGRITETTSAIELFKHLPHQLSKNSDRICYHWFQSLSGKQEPLFFIDDQSNQAQEAAFYQALEYIDPKVAVSQKELAWQAMTTFTSRKSLNVVTEHLPSWCQEIVKFNQWAHQTKNKSRPISMLCDLIRQQYINRPAEGCFSGVRFEALAQLCQKLNQALQSSCKYENFEDVVCLFHLCSTLSAENTDQSHQQKLNVVLKALFNNINQQCFNRWQSTYFPASLLAPKLAQFASDVYCACQTSELLLQSVCESLEHNLTRSKNVPQPLKNGILFIQALWQGPKSEAFSQILAQLSTLWQKNAYIKDKLMPTNKKIAGQCLVSTKEYEWESFDSFEMRQVCDSGFARKNSIQNSKCFGESDQLEDFSDFTEVVSKKTIKERRLQQRLVMQKEEQWSDQVAAIVYAENKLRQQIEKECLHQAKLITSDKITFHSAQSQIERLSNQLSTMQIKSVSSLIGVEDETLETLSAYSFDNNDTTWSRCESDLVSTNGLSDLPTSFQESVDYNQAQCDDLDSIDNLQDDIGSSYNLKLQLKKFAQLTEHICGSWQERLQTMDMTLPSYQTIPNPAPDSCITLPELFYQELRTSIVDSLRSVFKQKMQENSESLDFFYQFVSAKKDKISQHQPYLICDPLMRQDLFFPLRYIFNSLESHFGLSSAEILPQQKYETRCLLNFYIVHIVLKAYKQALSDFCMFVDLNIESNCFMHSSMSQFYSFFNHRFDRELKRVSSLSSPKWKEIAQQTQYLLANFQSFVQNN